MKVLQVRQMMISLFALIAVTLISCKSESEASAGQGAFPPPEVGVVTVQAADIPLCKELVGRLAATRISEVRAQVEGIVLKRHFREGSDVKANEQLFQVDSRLYNADLTSAKAALSQAEAEHLRATQKVDRYAPLRSEHAVSELDYESAVADAKGAEAAVASARAQISRAELNLSYSKISAPISGRIGRALVTEGALVGRGEPTHVATIEQIDPIYVNFTQASADILRLRRSVEAGKVQESGKSSVEVQLVLEDGQLYPLSGRFDFSDLRVDPDTGTVNLRATFPNPKHELLPGMFVKVRFQEGISHNAMLVPQAAVQIGPQGSHVMTLGADGVVGTTGVKAAVMQGTNWIVTEGLQEGTQVIVDGLQKIHSGAPAKGVPFVPAGAQADSTMADAQNAADANPSESAESH